MAGFDAAERGNLPEGGPRHPGLSHHDVLASGGWHPRYARALIIASDGDSGFALMDGNGDGAELEEELWQWEDGPGGYGRWQGGSSSGAGSLDHLPPLVAGGHIGPAYFPYGRVPKAESVTIEFEQRRYEVPVVSPLGVWGFIREAAGLRPGASGSRVLKAGKRVAGQTVGERVGSAAAGPRAAPTEDGAPWIYCASMR